MDNPLEKPRKPENFQQDIEDLARDLAYGIIVGGWNSELETNDNAKWGLDWADRQDVLGLEREKELFTQKWVQQKWLMHKPPLAPSYAILRAFGYLSVSSKIKTMPNGQAHYSNVYALTQKAFDLLQRPAQAPSIFISYRRKESSTFALLVEARLRMAGADPKRIFIDKTIPIGDEWESHLVERLTSCQVFICLVGKTAFDDGSWLQREIEILKERNPQAVILPILHNGVTLSSPVVQEFFGSRQSATVKEESALEYENAINHILNRLGYETYWPSPTSPFSGL